MQAEYHLLPVILSGAKDEQNQKTPLLVQRNDALRMQRLPAALLAALFLLLRCLLLFLNHRREGRK